MLKQTMRAERGAVRQLSSSSSSSTCSIVALTAAATLTMLTTAAHAALVPATLVAAVGSTLPGSNGATVTSLNQPVVNGLGQVGFTGALSTPESFMYVNNGIALRTSTVASPVLSGSVEAMSGIGNAGQYAFSMNADGEDSVYTNNGLLIRGTQAAPGLAGLFIRASSRPTMTPDGSAYWVSTTNTTGTGAATGRVLYKATPGGSPTITPLYKTGDALDGLVLNGVSPGFQFEPSDNNAHLAVNVPLATTSTGGATQTDQVVDGVVVGRTGGATGQGDNYQAFKSINVNNSGSYVFTGDTDGATSSDDFINYNGSIVLREGTVVGARTLGVCNVIAINNNDNVVSVWTFNANSANKMVLVGTGANPAAGGALIATGDTIDTNGDLVADYTLTDISMGTTVSKGIDLSDSGPIYLSVSLTPIAGGAAVSAIIGVSVPEPTSMLGTAAVMFGLAMRRRRSGTSV